MEVEFLKTYLEYSGIPYKDSLGSLVFVAASMENPNKTTPYTCYYNNPTKVQYAKADKTKAFTHVFWLIHNLEVPVLCNDAQEKAKRAARIFREWWNLQFNGVTEWGVSGDTKTSTEPVQSTSTQSVNADELAAEVKALRGTVEQLTAMMATLMKHLNCDVPTPDVTTATDKGEDKIATKTTIINKILEHASLVPTNNRFKPITLEQIAKENKPERKQDLQQAYNNLKERRLLTAKYRPEKGWKFDFNRRSIELQYRVDNRNSAVYCSRHRPLTPPIIDGKPVKELGDKGQSYPLPYGLEKLDYSYKTIFVAEGIFDSCFLKNCLAQSNWILPHEMSKVIDLYREAGFQIIHVPDNYRIGDKGGLKFYHHVVNTRDWLSKGDKVFNWSIYSDCDDLNKIAMQYGLDEIDP